MSELVSVFEPASTYNGYLPTPTIAAHQTPQGLPVIPAIAVPRTPQWLTGQLPAKVFVPCSLAATARIATLISSLITTLSPSITTPSSVFFLCPSLPVGQAPRLNTVARTAPHWIVECSLPGSFLARVAGISAQTRQQVSLDQAPGPLALSSDFAQARP